MPEYLKIGINTVLRIDTQSPFSKEDQQALSLSAMLSWSNGWVLNTLDYIPGKVHNRRRESMKTSWGINNRDSALEVLNWLSTEGHRSTWNETFANFFEPSEFISNYANNLLYSEIALKDLGIIDSWEDVCKIDIDAWDWGRLVFLARYCYLDDYITEDEFWEYVRLAYSEVKQRYKNWAEYSNAYILGRFVWGGPQQNDEDLMLVHLTMLEEPESIWNKLPLHPQHVSEYEAQKSKILKKATFFIEHATPVWTLQNKLQQKFSLSKLFSSDKDAEEKGIRDYEKAKQYKQNGDTKKAREYFLLAAQNGRHKAMLEIATIDLKDKNYQSATEFYTMALDIPTLKMNGHFGLGLVAFYQNNMSVFQEHADYLHSHYSSVFPLNLYLQEGELLYAQKQYQKAITAYTKTLGYGIEDRFSVLIKLASCYVMLDERNEAIDVYAQAYYIQPKPKLIEIMVTLLLELKQFEPAKEWIAIAGENGWKDLEIDLKERLDDEVREN